MPPAAAVFMHDLSPVAPPQNSCIYICKLLRETKTC